MLRFSPQSLVRMVSPYSLCEWVQRGRVTTYSHDFKNLKRRLETTTSKLIDNDPGNNTAVHCFILWCASCTPWAFLRMPRRWPGQSPSSKISDRPSKYDSLADEAELIDSNPYYFLVKVPHIKVILDVYSCSKISRRVMRWLMQAWHGTKSTPFSCTSPLWKNQTGIWCIVWPLSTCAAK